MVLFFYFFYSRSKGTLRKIWRYQNGVFFFFFTKNEEHTFIYFHWQKSFRLRERAERKNHFIILSDAKSIRRLVRRGCVEVIFILHTHVYKRLAAKSLNCCGRPKDARECGKRKKHHKRFQRWRETVRGIIKAKGKRETSSSASQSCDGRPYGTCRPTKVIRCIPELLLSSSARVLPRSFLFFSLEQLGGREGKDQKLFSPIISSHFFSSSPVSF